MVHLISGKDVIIKCDTYRINPDTNEYEFFLNGTVLFEYKFKTHEVKSIDDPIKLAPGFKIDKNR